MSLYCFIFLFLAFFTKGAIGQACGGGVYTITIYTLNGTENLDFRYELYYLKSDSLLLQYLRYQNTIPNKYVDSIITLGKPLESGAVKNSTFRFMTTELNRTPYLLKVYTKDKTMFLRGTFKGGCDSWRYILWSDDHPRFK